MREVGALVAAGPVAGQLGHVHVTVGRGGRGGGEGAHAGGGRHPGPARRIFSNEQETLGDLPGVARVQEVGGGRRRRSGAVHVPLVGHALVLQDIIDQERGGDVFLVVGGDVS